MGELHPTSQRQPAHIHFHAPLRSTQALHASTCCTHTTAITICLFGPFVLRCSCFQSFLTESGLQVSINLKDTFILTYNLPVPAGMCNLATCGGVPLFLIYCNIIINNNYKYYFLALMIFEKIFLANYILKMNAMTCFCLE